MKRKRTYILHHSNEWVVVLSLSNSCYVGPIAVWIRIRCRQWSTCHPPWQWWASTSGMIWVLILTPVSLNTQQQYFRCLLAQALTSRADIVHISWLKVTITPTTTYSSNSLCLFVRSLASIWALDYFLPMAREKWTIYFAISTRRKKDEHLRHVSPFHPMGVCQ